MTCVSRLLIFVSLSLLASPTVGENKPLKFCSDGFDAPAVMEFTDPTYKKMSMSIGGKVETYVLLQSEGPQESMQLLYTAGSSDEAVTVIMTQASLGNALLPVMLFKDRVFWTCEAKQ